MKYAVISTSNSSEYYSLIPIVAYSWHKLGYTPIVIMVNCPMELQELIGKYCPENTVFRSLPVFEGVRDGTIAQFSRLFAASMLGGSEDILITGDGDMIVMKDIFVNSGFVESYGKDLTGYSENPICYVSASVRNWIDLMRLYGSSYIRDNISLAITKDFYSKEWGVYWSLDQKILTANIDSFVGKVVNYDRGFSGPVAANRWDRYNWNVIPSDIIDVHCIRGLNRWDEITAMAEYLFPGEVGWMADFYNEIKALGV